MDSANIDEIGMATTAAPYVPQNANVANRDRSSGGAQNLENVFQNSSLEFNHENCMRII